MTWLPKNISYQKASSKKYCTKKLNNLRLVSFWPLLLIYIAAQNHQSWSDKIKTYHDYSCFLPKIPPLPHDFYKAIFVSKTINSYVLTLVLSKECSDLFNHNVKKYSCISVLITSVLVLSVTSNKHQTSHFLE